MSLKVNRNGNFQIGNTSSGGSPVSGTIEITKNGVYDVSTFAEADVQTPVPSGKITITENGSDIDVSSYATADVNVQGSGGITVEENYTISEGVLSSASVELVGDVVANIPDGVVTIGNAAFARNDTITKVIMPNSVLSIENGQAGMSTYGAFIECTNLSTVILSENITSIGDYAFYGVRKIQSIVIPVSVTSIGDDAFGNCPSLTDIYYTGTQAEWEQISIGADAMPTGATIHYEYTPT